jgi:hypothetical protein
MIQRIQTIWLLLAAGCSTATLFFPFYSGNKENQLYEPLTAQSGFLSLVLTVAIILGTVISIFLYKNRKKQWMVTIANLILQLVMIGLFLKQTNAYQQGDLSFTAIFSFAIPVFLILALIGIHKDEKLIRSMDRLR